MKGFAPDAVVAAATAEGGVGSGRSAGALLQAARSTAAAAK
jgi:hypothetical protein